MKIYDLPVMGYERAKSFYGKAKIIETDNGEKVLQSYNTFVCHITAAGRGSGCNPSPLIFNSRRAGAHEGR